MRAYYLGKNRRRALRAAAFGLQRGGRLAQAAGLYRKVKDLEYQFRMRKARRINARQSEV